MRRIPNGARQITVPDSIFCEIKPPTAQADLSINGNATWHTWSRSFRKFLRDAADEFGQLGKPRISHILGLKYGSTYSLSPKRLTDAGLSQRFAAFSRSLHDVRPSRKIMLLDDLLCADLDSKKLRALLALLRGSFATSAADERAAMYSPLGEVGKRAGGFPLHSDLFIPQILLNVFDEVSADDSGASTFLPVATLRQLLPKIKFLPVLKAKEIVALFAEKSPADHFDMLYDLLHGSHRWVRNLEHAMEQRQFRIKLHAGQGYLLNDRFWLHGREAPLCGVSINRLHRLVFGTSSPK
jgi:hypothetical protein